MDSETNDVAREPKRLYRSDTNYIIGGVLGGLGEYFHVDPTIFRVLWIVVTLFTAILPGIVAYILALLIVPPRRHA